MAKKRTKSKLPAIESTIGKAAKRLGIHERTLREWLAAGCPGKRGAYDVEAIAAWRAANRKPANSAAVGETSERAGWEARKSRAEALGKELELRKQLGQLIEVDTAARVMKQHVAEVRAHLEQLPDRTIAAVKLPGDQKKKLRALMAEWVRDYCQAFEASLRALAKAAQPAPRAAKA